MCDKNSAFQHIAWSMMMLPSRWCAECGAVPLTRSVSCKKWHVHFRDHGWVYAFLHQLPRVLSRHRDGAVALVIARRGETTHSGDDVNNTHPSIIKPLNIAFNTAVIDAERESLKSQKTHILPAHVNYAASVRMLGKIYHVITALHCIFKWYVRSRKVVKIWAHWVSSCGICLNNTLLWFLGSMSCRETYG